MARRADSKWSVASDPWCSDGNLPAATGVTGKQLTVGERRRLDLAVAILGRPELLFLDEPTAGLDHEGRRPPCPLPGTVRNYLSSAASKLGAADRHEAVHVARTHGWS